MDILVNPLTLQRDRSQMALGGELP